MRPGPRRSIAQADIVAAAFEILEQKGFAAVSVRGVAAALGLTPTAMYTYFDSKGALLGAMVEELLDDLGADDLADPRERILGLATALRARLRAHAGAIVLMTSGPLDGPRGLRLVERLGAAFAAAGLSEDDAVRAAHAVLAQVLGQVAVETAWGGASVGATPATLWTEEPAHPFSDAAARLGLRDGDDAEFRRALERVVDGCLAAAPALANPVSAPA